MIAQLKGVVSRQNLGSVVLDVGGVGYLIALTERSAQKLPAGSKANLHTHLAVRENALDLYGFISSEELECFDLLLTIAGVGPKSALSIMNQADVSLIQKAVAMEDAVYLQKMSGIGKKSAEKIVAGLKDKISAGEAPLTESERSSGDLIDALVTLGYSQKDARDAAARIPPEITSTNEKIKAALKELGTSS